MNCWFWFWFTFRFLEVFEWIASISTYLSESFDSQQYLMRIEWNLSLRKITRRSQVEMHSISVRSHEISSEIFTWVIDTMQASTFEPFVYIVVSSAINTQLYFYFFSQHKTQKHIIHIYDLCSTNNCLFQLYTTRS